MFKTISPHCLKKNLNASRPFKHLPVRGKNVKTLLYGSTALFIIVYQYYYYPV